MKACLPFTVSAAHLTAWTNAFPPIPSKVETFFWRQVAVIMDVPVDLEDLKCALVVLGERKKGSVYHVKQARDGSAIAIGGVWLGRTDPRKPFVVSERRAYAHEQIPLMLATG